LWPKFFVLVSQTQFFWHQVEKIRRKKWNTVGAQDYESNCTQIGVGHIPVF
jgi:hypothetical protein